MSDTETKTPIPTPLTDADLHATDEQNQYITASLARRIERALTMANRELAQARAENAELNWCKEQNEILVFAAHGSLGSDRGKNAVADMVADTIIERDALRAQIAALMAAGDAMHSDIITLRVIYQGDTATLTTHGRNSMAAWDSAKERKYAY